MMLSGEESVIVIFLYLIRFTPFLLTDRISKKGGKLGLSFFLIDLSSHEFAYIIEPKDDLQYEGSFLIFLSNFQMEMLQNDSNYNTYMSCHRQDVLSDAR